MNQKYFMFVCITLITLPIFTSNSIEDSLKISLSKQENLSKTVEQLHNLLKNLHAKLHQPEPSTKLTPQPIPSTHCFIPSGSFIEPQKGSNSQNALTDEKTKRQEITNQEFLSFSQILIQNYANAQQLFMQKQKELSDLNNKIENIRYQILTGFTLENTPIKLLRPISPLLLPDKHQ